MKGEFTTRVLTVILSVANFLLAAKAHGRQVRLEREAAGEFISSFSGAQSPFVQALWRRDRIRFWITAAITAFILTILVRWLRSKGILVPFGGSLMGTIGSIVYLSMTCGFVLCGLWSWVGTESDLYIGLPNRISFIFWTSVLMLLALTTWLAWR